MRASVEVRLRGVAKTGLLDIGQLRRRFVFQRVLRRLAEEKDWILKGGFLLETRIPVGARATKDLDFATATTDSDEEMTDRLQEALEIDDDNDFLVFTIKTIKGNRRDLRGRASWTVSLSVDLDGRNFDNIKLDIAERLDEVEGATELLTVPRVVAIEGLEDVLMPAVDVCQHAAEKFHALCLIFPDGRPNTRVKDLVDIVLFQEAGLLPAVGLTERLFKVFELRDGAKPPLDLPAFPASWEQDYQAMVQGLALGATSVGLARTIAQRIYQDAVVQDIDTQIEGTH